MPETTPKPPTEAEARESLDDAVSHFAAFRTQDNRDAVDDCIDAYAEAVRAAERARVAGLVRTLREVMVPMSMRLGGELVDRANVLRLLTEDTAR